MQDAKGKYSLNRYTALLVCAGILVNLGFSRLVLWLELPLYLDSIGTILTAAVGGYLPGIIVGFFSNAINGLADPITLYYGIISILIAAAAAFLADRGWLERPLRALCSVLIFSFIGGVLGSLLTWLLYGYSFGSGITAPFALLLHGTYGFSKFAAELTADVVVDLADKLLTVLICFLVIRFVPDSLLARYGNGRLRRGAVKPTRRRMHSLRGKVVGLIVVTSVILGCLATAISSVIYRGTMTEHYAETATSVAEMALSVLEPDSIDAYLASGEEGEEYRAVEAKLKQLRDNVPDIEYVYVYQIDDAGCRVVFDVDTPDLEGEPLGCLLPIEETFAPYKTALLAGESIPPVISNDSYGWLLTAYVPVLDSAGRCVAYAAADVSMDKVMTDTSVFVIKMISLLFGASILIVAFALWFAEKYLVNPINAIARAADEFAYDSERERLETTRRLQQLNVHTGDEIENLYGALKKTVTDVSAYIADIHDKNETITQMQNNIIISFADMVESRDHNTGEHIRRTAAYVRAIALELAMEGQYGDIMTPAYIDTIVRSAPLHDLGKISISDAILNKPGKLTPEEFACIETHTTAGREIIEGVIRNIRDTDYLAEAENMAESHHERWDGSGYPHGLSGSEIPLSARIMAVADVYDALLSKRSYKAPMSAAQATEIIRNESGTHFDPVIVAAFLNAKTAIDAISTADN